MGDIPVDDLARLLLFGLPPVLLLAIFFPVWVFSSRLPSHETRTAVRAAAFCLAVLPMGVVDPEGGSHLLPAVVVLFLAIFNPFFQALFVVQFVVPWTILSAIFIGAHRWRNRTAPVSLAALARGAAVVLASIVVVTGGVFIGFQSLFNRLSNESGLDPETLFLAIPGGLLAGSLALWVLLVRAEPEKPAGDGAELERPVQGSGMV